VTTRSIPDGSCRTKGFLLRHPVAGGVAGGERRIISRPTRDCGRHGARFARQAFGAVLLNINVPDARTKN